MSTIDTHKSKVLKARMIHSFTNSDIVRDEDIEHYLDTKVPKGQVGILSTSMIWSDVTLELVRSLFICQRCGWCCSKCDVQLLDSDISTIANYLNVRTRKIRHMMDDRNYFKKSINKGTCPFLKDNNCTIYSVRPIVCKLYPFIPAQFQTTSGDKTVIGIVQCKGARIMTPKLTKMINSIKDIQNSNRGISKENIERIAQNIY